MATLTLDSGGPVNDALDVERRLTTALAAAYAAAADGTEPEPGSYRDWIAFFDPVWRQALRDIVKAGKGIRVKIVSTAISGDHSSDDVSLEIIVGTNGATAATGSLV